MSRLWFSGPAERWEGALPLGSGRFGAMCWGTGRFDLNDDRMWSGAPARPVDGVARVLAAREAVLAGDPEGAEELLRSVQGPDTGVYRPLGTLRVHGLEPGEGYERSLDLRTGVADVRYSEGVRQVAVCSSEHHALAVRVEGAPHVTADVDRALPLTRVEEPGAVVFYAGLADPPPWREFHDRAVADHRALFDRVALDLGPAPDAPVDEWPADDPALAALLFQYGRYLLIASSRPGTLPANLQGVWNPHADPPWRSNYTLNINTQMNYWAAEPTGLPECHEPLFDFVDGLARRGAETARSLYGADGWCAHHNSDPWFLTTPVQGDPAWANWPMAGAWLCLHLWEHYAFTGDAEWLRTRAWPLMLGAADFCRSWVFEHDGVLTTAPSTSPENHYESPSGNPVAVGVGSTMDLTLVWELFTRLREAGEVLDLPVDTSLLDRLPSLPIGSRGQLLEWAREARETEPRHRHVSHLVGLYPGSRIRRGTPEAEAARRVLEERGDEGPGWSHAWKAVLWARLGDGTRAASLLAAMPRCENLVAANPFQVDGSLGLPAAVAEMLVQSHTGVVELLPALPTRWRHGSITGLRARGGLTVDLHWRDGEPEAVAITARTAREVVLRHGERVEVLRVRPGTRHDLSW
ncbi:glycosyl hydrolase family 95 catalytic domain-containing protein [Saccharothrix longispora]|uniref:glycosyl hydrolase family 95 catalytic domain-containing protein n=1 Tax=Saccharothrix longispora TaxID=33920 RepID=UPI0028FD9C82|nr:glycoside hydrolase N-terminal domain-containing protein [Saccharothrix longispora]MDU0294326.1 glycoside hydrolase N-terminal domain-containing protein [Saccharothrix longispora]